MKSFLVISGLGLLCLVSGCVTSSDKYYWGSYENTIYKMYAEPGSEPPLVQIDILLSDIQQAEDAGLDVPPGVYAHLGFMYAANGNLPKAEEAFSIEKSLFPESAILIDGMLKRAKQAVDGGP